MPEETIRHYLIVRRLGQGGMGEVYLAQDTRLDRNVALKVLPKEYATDALRRQRFLTEAKAASALNHPNVCVVYDVGETEDHRPYIAMEYLDGPMLDGRLARGVLPIPEILAVGIQITDALAAAHARGIVHRDIKPSNISLNDRGIVKVLDFGLAKWTHATLTTTSDAPTQVQTRSGQVLGTPSYLSPEQALGKPVDGRGDLFSLGVVLYQMTTGKLPFEGLNLGDVLDKILHAHPVAVARLNYDAPVELERIIRKCLEKDPDRRYQGAREILADLKNLQRDFAETAPATPEPVVAPTPPTEPQREAMPLEVLKESGIYLSYAPIDDYALEPGRQGWIAQFHRNLEIRLKQLTGDDVRIFRDQIRDDALTNEQVIRWLPEIRAMVSVVSPTFVRSERCRRELEAFLASERGAGSAHATGHPGARVNQVLSALKAPVPPGQLPFVISHLLTQRKSIEFFERDADTGRIRELDEAFGDRFRRRYQERIYDLAYELSDVLRARPERLESPAQGSRSTEGRNVYLAETTTDLQEEHAIIRRELLELGHAVLPDKPLPTEAEELNRAVSACMRAADFSVHLVGANYGLIPENAMVSVSELQHQLAVHLSGETALRRLIWMPRGLAPSDARQVTFVRRLEEREAEEARAEILKVNLSSFKELLETRLRPKAPPLTRLPSTPGAEKLNGVYLICDSSDEPEVERLEDFLFEQGLEVALPDFESDPEEGARLHRAHLTDCDAVLIYFGQVRHGWVEIQLRDVLKAVGYGRSRPLRACGVYIAPPVDRRKERFRSHAAHIIRQPGDRFETFPELIEFVAAAMSQKA